MPVPFEIPMLKVQRGKWGLYGVLVPSDPPLHEYVGLFLLAGGTRRRFARASILGIPTGQGDLSSHPRRYQWAAETCMPERAFFFQEEVRCSARVRAAMDTWK